MRRSGWLAGAVLVASLALSGCGVQMSDEEQLDSAREVNAVFKGAVAQVQLQVLDGDWDVVENYGRTPRGCGGASDRNEYQFSMSRATPSGWKLGQPPAELGDEIAAWFDENGWSGIKLRTYSEGIADVVVEAKKPDEFAGLVVVDIKPGELFDTVTVRAKSTCESGDWMTIYDQQAGSAPDADPVETPATEYPTDTPIFDG